MKKNRQIKEDKSQHTLFDFGDFTEEEKLIIQTPIAHENHIGDSKVFDATNSKVLSKDEKEEPNLRSEQIHISKENYPSISFSDSKDSFSNSINNISRCCHFSKNLYNQCLFQIRQSFFNRIYDNNDDNNVEANLRIKIRSALKKFKEKGFNYKNTIYKLLDKHFKDKKDDNYIWSPQAAQQTIDLAVEAWYDNDLAREDYEKHPDKRKDYTGKPGICNYRRKDEYISVFTNQQCHIETKSILDLDSMNDVKLIYTNKNFLTFPDHLNIKPIETRFSDKTDLREVRIIPQMIGYKVEAVYKKKIDEKYIQGLNLDPNRIIGIDTGQENVVTIADNIGNSPIIIKGGILLAINQWFDKIGSKLYSIYYRQQKHEKGKKEKIVMGERMKILSQNRSYKVLDILHKISRFIINYCIEDRIGTIVYGRNPGWKQNINIGRKNNQKFTKIPHYLLFKILKYKGEEVGIKVIDHEEAHTSKCSFLDNEPICHHEKYMGKRTKRGLFRSAKGIIINADVNAAYNIIRKVFPEAFKGIGIVGVVLHPKRLSIKDLLSRPNSIG